MAHAKMFDQDDPFLARVLELGHGLPQAAERVSHGRPAFYTKKVFCYYGGSLKADGTVDPASALDRDPARCR